jgi:hypothetical protein
MVYYKGFKAQPLKPKLGVFGLVLETVYFEALKRGF